jgi:hypothetical protein
MLAYDHESLLVIGIGSRVLGAGAVSPSITALIDPRALAVHSYTYGSMADSSSGLYLCAQGRRKNERHTMFTQGCFQALSSSGCFDAVQQTCVV